MSDAAPSIKADLPHGTKALLEKALRGNADKDMLLDAARAINEIVDDMNGKIQAAKKKDPYWFYEPTDGTITPQGMELLKEFLLPEDIPKNLDGAMHVHASNAPMKIVGGGNQSGKTTTMTIEDLIKGTGELPFALRGVFPVERLPKKGERQRIRVICEDYTHGILNHNLPAMRQWAPKGCLINGSFDDSWSEKRQTLTLVDPKAKEICGEIEFMSNQAKVETFQGPPLNRVRFDEEPDKPIYDENLLRFVTTELDMGFGMTPTKGLTWVYNDLWTQSEGPQGARIATFQLCSVINPKANLKSLREIVSKIHEYDRRKMRLLGEWVSLSGLIYGAVFKKRIHVVSPERLGLSQGSYLKCSCPHVVADRNNDPMRAEHKPGCRFLNWMIFSGLDPHTVKATAAVFLALDRNGTHVLDACYHRKASTAHMKRDLRDLRHGYRYTYTVCDPSADSDNTALDDRNIYKELRTGPDRIPNLRKGDKYKGSILAGVDVMIQLLAVGQNDLPQFVIVDRPENQLLIQSMLTLERDSWNNEEKKGQKDAILEGKHDHHAATRYVLQKKLVWRPYEPAPDFSTNADLDRVAEMLEAS